MSDRRVEAGQQAIRDLEADTSLGGRECADLIAEIEDFAQSSRQAIEEGLDDES